MKPSQALRAVLAGTDLSAPSRHAAERAAALAKAHGAAVTLLHVVSGSEMGLLRVWSGMGARTEEALLAQASAELHTIAAEVAKHTDYPLSERLSVGAVVAEVLKAAAEVDADLIVVGARGAGFVRQLALGSTAERLLRKSTRPVLVVRQMAHEAYLRVLVPVDFSASSAAAITLAQGIAPGAHLVLLHAWQVPFEEKLQFAGVNAATVEHYRADAQTKATQQLHQLAAGQGLPRDAWTPLLVQGNASMLIVEQEQEQDCDLIVIGKHGVSVVEDLLLGSVTQHVLTQTQADVLVV